MGTGSRQLGADTGIQGTQTVMMNDFPDTERNLFRRMETSDQVMALFDMTRYIRSEVAAIRKDIIELRDDLKSYRATREEKEQNTTAKIKAVLNERFDLWKWFVDKVLPTIATTIILALLYLAFSKP
jgi:hypothetical protein